MSSRTIIIITILSLPCLALAQSKVTNALGEKYSDSRAFYLYHNTLRMLNQTEDTAFDELIQDIEKMKLLIVKKESSEFDPDTYKKLVSDYKRDAFEEIMTSRHDGKSFDIFLKENKGKTKGMLVLVDEGESLFILDIVGSIPLNKVTDLYQKIDESADLGKQIRSFVSSDK